MSPDRYFRSSVRKYRFSRMEKTLSEASLRVGANKTIKFRPGLQAANPARSLFIITAKQEEKDIGFLTERLFFAACIRLQIKP